MEMDENCCVTNISYDDMDIYEVNKDDYSSYFYRLPENEIIKTTPQEGISIYKDLTTNYPICGTKIENIMGTRATRYFIFNFIDESRLGPEKVIKHIYMSLDAYKDFLTNLSNINSIEE